MPSECMYLDMSHQIRLQQNQRAFISMKGCLLQYAMACCRSLRWICKMIRKLHAPVTKQPQVLSLFCHRHLRVFRVYCCVVCRSTTITLKALICLGFSEVYSMLSSRDGSMWAGRRSVAAAGCWWLAGIPKTNHDDHAGLNRTHRVWTKARP